MRTSFFSKLSGACRKFGFARLCVIPGCAAAALLCLPVLAGYVLAQDGALRDGNPEHGGSVPPGQPSGPPPEPASISFAQRNYSVNEGESVTLTVEKEGVGAVSVQYVTLEFPLPTHHTNTPAEAYVDYMPVVGMLPFRNADTSMTFKVETLADDDDTEPAAEQFFVQLVLSPGGGAAGPDAELGDPYIATVTIRNK